MVIKEKEGTEYRYKLFVKGLQDDLVVCFFNRKFGNEYIDKFDNAVYCLKFFVTPYEQEVLGLENMIIVADDYDDEISFVFHVENNKESDRKEIATNLIKYLNDNQVERNDIGSNVDYEKVQNCVSMFCSDKTEYLIFGGDITRHLLETADSHLDNIDIMNVLMNIYGDGFFSKVLKEEKLLKKYWKNIEYGKSVVNMFESELYYEFEIEI